MNKNKERACGGNRQTRINKYSTSELSIAEITADVHCFSFCGEQQDTGVEQGRPGRRVTGSKGEGRK
ncbi:MAG: hypothetical protein BWY09_00226 [Candidatus Hydrogenedentes bacterium ADurb.Bin179]|nr:MAG: hypothetical protein BWY09_00226 [Candidatus Hydrogenedentes bacterium ADurb.Bin179]